MAVGKSDLRLIDLSAFGWFFMLTVTTQKSALSPVPDTARKVKGDFWPKLFLVMIVFEIELVMLPSRALRGRSPFVVYTLYIVAYSLQVKGG